MLVYPVRWQRASIKYLHLNPSIYFAELLSKCRSVIIAGGTISPLDDFIRQLMPTSGIKREVCKRFRPWMLMLYGQIDTFSCGHIIPAENLCVLAVSRGPQDKPLNFRYDSRSDEVVCDAWWHTLC